MNFLWISLDDWSDNLLIVLCEWEEANTFICWHWQRISYLALADFRGKIGQNALKCEKSPPKRGGPRVMIWSCKAFLLWAVQHLVILSVIQRWAYPMYVQHVQVSLVKGLLNMLWWNFRGYVHCKPLSSEFPRKPPREIAFECFRRNDFYSCYWWEKTGEQVNYWSTIGFLF